MTESEFAVLNTIVLKKMTRAAVVADLTGLPLADVNATVATLEGEGAIFRMDADVMVTETGTAMAKDSAGQMYAQLRDDPDIERWHARFEPLNRQLLRAITSWQTIDVGGSRVPNEHADAEYDEKVRSQIDAIVTKMGRLLDELGAKVPRLLRYRERLTDALARADAGDARFISDVRVDSIHSIWFEMHEDVLLVLGKERNDAGG
jgi:hypothetical protein